MNHIMQKMNTETRQNVHSALAPTRTTSKMLSITVGQTALVDTNDVLQSTLMYQWLIYKFNITLQYTLAFGITVAFGSFR